MCYAKPGPRCSTHVLSQLIERSGMAKNSSDAAEAARMDLLQTRGGLEALAERISKTRQGYYRRELIAAYKSAKHGWLKRAEKIGVTPKHIPNEPAPHELEESPYLVDKTKLNNIAHGLYGYKGKSPLYNKAKEIEREHNKEITGYTPGTPQTTVIEHDGIAAKMNADLSKVPEGYVAIDIEADTTGDRGLRPHASQITEMVISTKEKSIVLSGDEKHILQGFADYMNSQEKPVTLSGWNTSGYDNSFMAIRARAHDIDGWNGSLSPSKQGEGFPAAGGFESPQELSWTGKDGVAHNSEDLMIAYKQTLGLSRFTGLKKTVREYGVEPIELDREKLHEYSPEEREAYVASDGIATLVILGELERFRKHKS